MSAAFDAASGAGGRGWTTLTFAHTVGSGSNRVLHVAVGWRDATRAVSSVTYNGVALTAIVGPIQEPTTHYDNLVIYQLLNPASGTHNIVVTMSGAITNGGSSAAISCSGVSATTPVGTPHYSTGYLVTSISDIVTGVADGMVVDFIVCGQNSGGNQSLTPAAGQNYRAQAPSGTTGGTDCIVGISDKTASGSVAMSWTMGTAVPVSHIAIPLNPYAGGGATTATESFTMADASVLGCETVVQGTADAFTMADASVTGAQGPSFPFYLGGFWGA